LGEADVLLLPLKGVSSIEMGISSKLYEYQAAGKPIVCCSRGQPARYVLETKSGIAVEPGDFEGLAKAMLCLYRSRKVVECFGRTGRRFVEENLSLGNIGSRMLKVFKRVARNHSRLQ